MYTMYTDPERELYNVLGMKSNPQFGKGSGSKKQVFTQLYAM